MKKIGKLSEKQEHFIKLFVNSCNLKDVLNQLDLKENDITNWLINDPLFASSFNSAIFLMSMDLYLANINLKREALESLERHVKSGDLESIKLSLNNKENFPEYDVDLFSISGVEKILGRKLLSAIERDIGTPPWHRLDRDDEAPF